MINAAGKALQFVKLLRSFSLKLFNIIKGLWIYI